MFIPELTTRVSVEMNTKDLDSAIDMIKSDPILGEIDSLVTELEDAKTKITDLQEPLVDGVADRLSSIQELIMTMPSFFSV